MKQKILIILFIVLYGAVGLVSVHHAVQFFGIANDGWLAILLACAFELGQASVLVALLSDHSQHKKVMPWLLMGTLTTVQVIGNIYASYQYMVQNSMNKIQYFIDSVMWFMKDPEPQTNIVICSYIIGAILPIIALCMTGMVVGVSGADKIEHVIEQPESEQPAPSNPQIFM